MFLTLAVPHPQEIIPEERRNAVLSKYFEETLLLADSLGHADYNVLDQHHTETGSRFSTSPISRIDKRFHGATPHHIPTRLHRFAPVPNPHSFFFHSAVSLRSTCWHSRSHADRRSQHADSRDGDRELDSLGNAQLFVDGSDAVQQSGSQAALRNGSQRHARHEEPSGQHANDVDDAFAEVGGSAAWRCRYPPIYAETKLDAYTKLLLTRLRK